MISLLILGKCSRLNRLLAITLVFIAQVGCTSIPSRSTGDWSSNEIAQRNWQGRFSSITQPVAADGITHTRDRESVSGQFSLSLSYEDAARADDQVSLELANPLGVAVARLSVRRGQALLQVANQPDREADDVNSLTEQAMGWRVPVDKMALWLDGAMNGTTTASDAKFDTTGRLTEAIDAGWQLTVEAWRDDGKPQRMRLIWPMSPSDAPHRPHTTVNLRLIVDSVTVNPASKQAR